MAKLAPYGPFRALDNNGDPLVGGKLYTYEAGTTTPKATFTNADGDIQNANPVILDLNGYANVWLEDGAYKFILKTSADATLWEVDDIQGDSTAAFGSQVVTQASNLAITNVYAQAIVNATATQTHSLPPAASVGSGFYYVVNNTSASGTVTVDPDGAETINGAANYAFTAGTSGIVYTDGSNWFTGFDKAVVAANLSARAANTVITNNTASSAAPAALAMGASTVLARLAAGNIVAATPTEINTLLTVAATTTKTSNYTVLTTDTFIPCDASGGSLTVTLYTAVGNSGRVVTIKKMDSTLTQEVTIEGDGTETIDGALNYKLDTQYESITLVSDGANWLIGNSLSVLNKYFVSSEQTITAGGSLTIAHGLSEEPTLIQPYLICKTAEGGYSIGDKYIFTGAYQVATASTVSFGASFVPDSTNINVRYGTFANIFSINNKTTGNTFNITPANWRLVIRAWA